MNNKKYKLLKSDKKTWDDKPLFQIQASISFGTIKKGDKGGYIEKEAFHMAKSHRKEAGMNSPSQNPKIEVDIPDASKTP